MPVSMTCSQDVQNARSAQSSRSGGHCSYQSPCWNTQYTDHSHSNYQSSKESSIGHYGMQPRDVLSRNLHRISKRQSYCICHIVLPLRQRRHPCVSEPCRQPRTLSFVPFNLQELHPLSPRVGRAGTGRIHLGRAVNRKATKPRLKPFSFSSTNAHPRCPCRDLAQ